MLPVSYRMRSAADFRGTIRHGIRVSGKHVVIHMRSDEAPQVGFIVSKKVGCAVIRNRVKRRIRHIVADELKTCRVGSMVVRALPNSALASYAELSADLRAAWVRVDSRMAGVGE